MILKEFTFIIRTPAGEEYEMGVPARREADAERLLRNLFDTLDSRDRVVSLKKEPHTDTDIEEPRFPPADISS